MEKVRFSCPRCGTVMQTAADRVGSEVACPQCQHRFRLMENQRPAPQPSDVKPDAPTLPPGSTPPVAPPLSHAPQQYDISSEHKWNERAPGAPPPPPQASPYAPQVNPYQSPMGAPQPPLHGTSFSCPYCGTPRPPRWKSEVSQLGWIVFAVLLITTCFLCFIGLMIRDRYRCCSQCNVRLE